MEYSMIGITAFVITLIICHSIIFTRKAKEMTKATRAYRAFLFAVLIYFATDSCWGIFNDHNLTPFLYGNTVLFFLSMSVSVFLWSRYATIYIGGKGKTNIFMYFIGILIMVFVATMLIINIFKPILFTITKEAGYDPNIGRYSLFIAQDVIYLLIALGAILESGRGKTKAIRNRYYVISLFSTSMTIAVLVQILFPFLPLYSIGYVVSICLVNSFIVDSEKEESRKKLEELLEREIRNQKELDSTKSLVYYDSLTGAQSKHAYVQMEEEMDKLIAANLINKFAVVVFDINGLKNINDTLGHQAGDKYIKDCYNLITEIYNGCKIYRFGGDEFVVVLQDDKYDIKDELLMKFETRVDTNLLDNKEVLSTGMSEFNLEVDNTYRAVFVRADKKMYERKKQLKSHGSYSR